jgi:hypothetical protein
MMLRSGQDPTEDDAPTPDAISLALAGGARV